MTMPHLMNCDHIDNGWCLDCVKKVGEENVDLRGSLRCIGHFLTSLEGELMLDLPYYGTDGKDAALGMYGRAIKGIKRLQSESDCAPRN